MLRFEMTDYARQRGYNQDALGFLPMLLDERDPRTAQEQLDENYAHGGGWHPLDGFRMNFDKSITYPGDGQFEKDERYIALAHAKLHDQDLYFYESEWLAVVDADGTMAVNRMD